MWFAALALPLAWQDPAEDAGRRIEALRKEFVGRISRAIDEEFARAAGPSEEVRRLEARLAQIRVEAAGIRNRLTELRWLERDAGLIEELRRERWGAGQASAAFQRGMAAHSEGRSDEAVATFKKIFYAVPGTPTATFAAYNVACAYAMQEKAAESVDWVRICVSKGYLEMGRCASGCHESKLDHLRGDSDFDKIRKGAEWEGLLRELEKRDQ
jgi:hypothetical protein